VLSERAATLPAVIYFQRVEMDSMQFRHGIRHRRLLSSTSDIQSKILPLSEGECEDDKHRKGFDIGSQELYRLKLLYSQMY